MTNESCKNSEKERYGVYMNAKKRKKRVTELKAAMFDTILKMYVTIDDEVEAAALIMKQLPVYEDLLITCNTPDEPYDDENDAPIPSEYVKFG